MTIIPYETSCDYFNIFSEVREDSPCQTTLEIIKITSLAILIIPATFALIYLASSQIKNRNINHEPRANDWPRFSSLDEALTKLIDLSSKLPSLASLSGLKSILGIDRSECARWENLITAISYRFVEAHPIEILSIEKAKLEILRINLSQVSKAFANCRSSYLRIYDLMLETQRSLLNVIDLVDDLAERSFPPSLMPHSPLFLSYFGRNGYVKGIIFKFLALTQEELESSVGGLLFFNGPEKPSFSPSIMHYFPLFLLQIGQRGRYRTLIPEFKKLTERELELTLAVLRKHDIALLAQFMLPFIDEAPKNLQKINAFQELTGVPSEIKTSITAPEIGRLTKIIKLIYRIKNSEIIPVTPHPIGLASSNANISERFLIDQGEYQHQFMVSVENAAELISQSKPFLECLNYLGERRNEMEPQRKDRFGVLRKGNKKFVTPLKGRYAPYLILFLNSSKSGWQIKWEPHRVTYTMSISIQEQLPNIRLTKIILTPDQAYWLHTKEEVIPVLLNHAADLYDKLIRLSHPEDQISLETLVKAVGELHWFLAHAAPFRRGSAAIAKMMVGAILKFHGVEAGGFGNIEPDCMALIQNLEEFKARYFGLMQFPHPRLISEESASSS